MRIKPQLVPMFGARSNEVNGEAADLGGKIGVSGRCHPRVLAFADDALLFIVSRYVSATAVRATLHRPW